MASQIQCSPLPRDVKTPTFRLLTLHPGNTGDPIVCSLHVAQVPDPSDLGSVIVYEALSYAWGPAESQHEITIGPWPVLIRENLWHFLCQWRHHANRVVLWIDALCIDQSNLAERAVQVQLMDIIYRGARRVIVWLGTASFDGFTVKRLLEKTLRKSSTIRNALNSSERRSLLSWSNRQYWSRTWVVQEFLLARSMVLVWGEQQIDWKDLENILFAMRTDPDIWLSFMRTPAYTLMQQRVDHRGVMIPMDELLIRNEHTNCHDPRDKVFAMLGLATSPKHSLRIKVSYTKDVGLLLWDVVEHCQIRARDLVRFVRFLAVLLHLPLAYASYEISQASLALKQWNLPIFQVGRLVRCDPIKASPLNGNKHAQAISLDRAQTLNIASSAKQLGKAPTVNFDLDLIGKSLKGPVTIAQVPELLIPCRMYDTNALEMLEHDHEVLEPINLRLRTHHYEQHQLKSRERVQAYSLTILTSSCEEKRFLIGIGYGNIKRGDRIFYFLGHGTAFTAEANLEVPTLTGRILCKAETLYMSQTEDIGAESTEYWRLQSEADLCEPGEQLKLNLSTSEVFRLSRS